MAEFGNGTPIRRSVVGKHGIVSLQNGSLRFTVQKPVYETQMRDHSYNRIRDIAETSLREDRYTVQRPVWETSEREECYTVMRQVTDHTHPAPAVSTTDH